MLKIIIRETKLNIELHTTSYFSQHLLQKKNLHKHTKLNLIKQFFSTHFKICKKEQQGKHFIQTDLLCLHDRQTKKTITITDNRLTIVLHLTRYRISIAETMYTFNADSRGKSRPEENPAVLDEANLLPISSTITCSGITSAERSDKYKQDAITAIPRSIGTHTAARIAGRQREYEETWIANPTKKKKREKDAKIPVCKSQAGCRQNKHEGQQRN